jgi:hypothetical protein
VFQEAFHLKPREFAGCKRKQEKTKCLMLRIEISQKMRWHFFWLNACFERLLFTQESHSTSFPTILSNFGTRKKTTKTGKTRK